MELADMLKNASDGTLGCPDCGAQGVALKNVRIAMGPKGPELDPNTYAECGSCGAHIAIEKLLKAQT